MTRLRIRDITFHQLQRQRTNSLSTVVSSLLLCEVQETKMSLLVYTALMLLSTFATCNACSCLPSHPQEHFCRARFAIRAKVLSRETLGGKFGNRVFNLRILKTFKGAAELNQTKDIRSHGSKQRSLFAKVYTSANGGTCGIGLNDETVYLLTGSIQGRKLWISWCDWIERWTDVTPRQRKGIRRYYGLNCNCRISPCYGEKSCTKLQGCRKSSGRSFFRSDCEWGHSYCLVNADKTACAWRKTPEYKNCTSQKLP